MNILYDIFSIGLYNSKSIEEGVFYQRFQFTTAALIGVAILSFINSLLVRKTSIVVKILLSIYSIYIFIPFIKSDLIIRTEGASVHEVSILGEKIFYYEGIPGIVVLMLFVFLSIGNIYNYVLLIINYKKEKNAEYLYLIITFTIFFLVVIYDMLISSRVLNSIYLTEYSFLCFVFAISALLFRRVMKLYTKVDIMNVKFKNIFNNASQGFLTFGEDFIIDEGFSKKCVEIFGMDLKEKKIIDLAYKNDMNFTKKIMKDIFVEKSKKKVNIYLGFLPEYLQVEKRHIKVEYKLIEELQDDKRSIKKMMLIIDDITDKKKLESEIKVEKNMLKMVVKSFINKSEFVVTINDYKYFCRITLDSILGSNNKVKEKVSEINKHMHTYKGSFSQLDMNKTVKKIHEFESKLFEIIQENENYDSIKFKKFIKKQKLFKWIEDDIKILENILGEKFFSFGNSYPITETSLKTIESKICNFIPKSEYKKLFPELVQLKKKSLKDMLNKYTDYVNEISKKYDKLVYTFNIEGEDFLVETEYFQMFANTLVHIFRNIVVHGIENPDERIELEKSEYGTIKCYVSKNDNIEIVISDDGRGIDIEKIKNKIIKDKLLSYDEVVKLSKDKIIEYIFKDNFTTELSANEYSGRGVGLFAVKDAVSLLNGSVKVETEYNVGTKFVFEIPINDNNEDDKSIVDKTLMFLQDEIQLYFENNLKHILFEKLNSNKNTNILSLKKYNVYINFRYLSVGRIIICMDEFIAEEISMTIKDKQVLIGEKENTFKENLGEFTNHIIGRALSKFKENNEYVKISSPTILTTSSDLIISYKNSNANEIELFFNKGSIKFILINNEIFDI